MESEIVKEMLKMGFETRKIRHCVKRLEIKTKFCGKSEESSEASIVKLINLYFYYCNFFFNVMPGWIKT